MKLPLLILAGALTASLVSPGLCQTQAPVQAAQTASPASPRSPDPTLTRIAQGPPSDPTRLPTTPIADWDHAALQSWMQNRLAQLGTSINDRSVRRLGQRAATAAAHATVDREFYRASASAAAYSEDGDDPQGRDKALYILLNAALAGRDEPFTFYALAGWLETSDQPAEQQLAFDAYRRAADRDFGPAFPYLADLARNRTDFTPDMLEAYLRYGVDLNAAHGGQDILPFAANFYVRDYPERRADGYPGKIVDRFYSYGDNQNATALEYLMLRNQIAPAADPAELLAGAKRALAAGTIWIAGDIGRMYQQGDGLPYDRDLARDYLVACLTDPMPDVVCALNLGSLYLDYSHASTDPAVAMGFYRYARDLDPTAATEAGRAAQAEIDKRMASLTPEQITRMEAYYAAIRAGDFAAIPHVGDARPVPELADAAH